MIINEVLHEAVSTGNKEFIREVLERRDLQRYTSRVDGIPILLKKICDVSRNVLFFWTRIY